MSDRSKSFLNSNKMRGLSQPNVMQAYADQEVEAHRKVFLETARELEHFKTTVLGLWATDKVHLVEDPNNIMFKIT